MYNQLMRYAAFLTIPLLLSSLILGYLYWGATDTEMCIRDRDWTMFYYFRLCIFAVVKMDNRNLYTNKQNIMEAKYITLTKENIEKEHICCAFSDKKCKDSYELKKTWLKKEFENGYVDVYKRQGYIRWTIRRK